MEANYKWMEALVTQIETVIVGKRKVVEQLVMALVCEGHVLIEDVPGTGKTTLALALSKAMGASMNRVSCTPDVMPSDLTGFTMYNPKINEFEYREGAMMANIFLADEINRTPPKTQSGLLEAMEERQVTVDGVVHKLPRPFLVMATQNAVEFLGTYPLPEAQLDRFFMKLSLGYPDLEAEITMMHRFKKDNPLHTLKPVLTLDQLFLLQEAVLRVTVSKGMAHYVAQVVLASRHNKNIALGISPRGTLNLVKACKAKAYYEGRTYVTPEDVKAMLMPVCGHRIVPRTEAKYDHLSREDIMAELLKQVAIPDDWNQEVGEGYA